MFCFVFLSAIRTQEGQTALQLAISNQLPLVVDAICTRGADMSVVNDKGDPPLWLALENGLEDIASTLVSTPCSNFFFILPAVKHQQIFVWLFLLFVGGFCLFIGGDMRFHYLR